MLMRKIAYTSCMKAKMFQFVNIVHNISLLFQINHSLFIQIKIMRYSLYNKHKKLVLKKKLFSICKQWTDGYNDFLSDKNHYFLTWPVNSRSRLWSFSAIKFKYDIAKRIFECTLENKYTGTLYFAWNSFASLSVKTANWSNL
jgi:hypothetical protein